jgi:peptide/nickel transport system permease protein
LGARIRFVLGRLLLAIPTLVAISAITFFLGALAPGDPTEIMLGQHADPASRLRLRHELGLDRPPLVQYGSYLWRAVHGDFGRSYETRRPVTDIVREGFPNTATLALAAIILASLFGVTLGVLAAARQDTMVDRAAMLVAISGASIPAFVLAPVLIVLFALRLRWLPVSGWTGPENLILPAVVLAARPAALIARLTRAQMVEVLRQDYIRTAVAKGLSWSAVVRKHALRNAMLPVLTVIGSSLGYLLSGSFVVETIFSVPGLGWYSIQSITRRDYPVIQATTLLMAVGFVSVNILVDLLYGWLDPRLKPAGGSVRRGGAAEVESGELTEEVNR